MRIRFAPVLLLFLAVLGPLPLARAVDLQARVETRYQLQAGDGALDNDVFLYHFLELPFLQRFTFGWTGGLRKDLDGKHLFDVTLRTNDPSALEKHLFIASDWVPPGTN